MSRLVMLGSLLIAVVVGAALERIYGWRDLVRVPPNPHPHPKPHPHPHTLPRCDLLCDAEHAAPFAALLSDMLRRAPRLKLLLTVARLPAPEPEP